MYYEAQEPLPHIVDDTPILIWLNGGPGCTSMIGNFYEIGPQRVTSNGSLVDFEFTWNKYDGVNSSFGVRGSVTMIWLLLTETSPCCFWISQLGRV